MSRKLPESLLIVTGVYLHGRWIKKQYNINTTSQVKLLKIFYSLFTGLLFYPVAFITFWQYRTRQVQNFSGEKFRSTAPFRWQTFAYPLPHLRHYLVKLAKQHHTKVALYAIQQVQLLTSQMVASRQAAQDLASDPETAIAFCGEVAVQTNRVTLRPFSLTGNVGRAVAGLAKLQAKEDKQSLELWVNDFPPPNEKIGLKEFQKIRQLNLFNRLIYAQGQLETCQNYQDVTAFQTLLTHLLQYAKINNTGDMLSMAEQPLSMPSQYPQWMQGGWIILQNFTQQLIELKNYRCLASFEARREYLTYQQKKLKTLEWEYLPDYWTTIGEELVTGWIALLEKSKEQAQNFLLLEIDLPQNSLLLGQQPLNLRVHNATSMIAKHLRIQMEETEGIYWNIKAAQHLLLEGGLHTDLHLECQIDNSGYYIIHGLLEAQDLDGNPFQQPFNFQVIVAEAGRPYTIPKYQPYVVGEGLSNDRTFVGRTDLLAWLASLWRQPEGKPTVVLVGQRRIGKTSLLHKIKRVGLKQTQLVPVFINIQEMSSEYDFLTTTSNEMAMAIGMDTLTLDRAEPYVNFKSFLTQTKQALQGRRFLLMLDEADLIPSRKLGDLLPGFLRSLMQQASYPTVLLFCGTYALKRTAWNYASILFNTAQFKTVSYLSAPESAELLQKPAQNILEFDDYVLEQAHVLTRGQPLLLQSLGAILIEECNAVVRAGKERSNYINFKDLEQAAQILVRQQDNAVFLEHWLGSDIATHRVLSVLAWATDEINRPQLDITGIQTALQENNLDLPRKQLFDIIHRLVDEDILEKARFTYRFVVPLYRRWIAWRWEPMTVREEGLEDS